MIFLHRLDRWLGRTLFHPSIIAACQLTRQTQYAVHRALWFFAFCYAAYFARELGWAWAAYVWLGAVATFVSATWFPDREVRSHGWFRFILWQLLAYDLIGLALADRVSAGIAQTLILLFAEYAATIKTIPPRRKRARRANHRKAHA
ncbi:MAG: hypothetical protein B7Z20_09565 [Sphingobium sp. 32-64-5]|nr:MAG: hypothetical protein B7Z20_09565 [Sphingobium sp. 32-64-5]